MAFDGTADYTLDAKNRLTVPARFRHLLAEGGVIAMAVDPCVQIWPKDDFEGFRRSALEGLHPMSQKAQKVKRFFSANAQPFELDGAGRVGVPAFLMEHASLTKEVTVIGADDHLEVWDRKAWQAYNAQLATEVFDMSAGFDEVGP